MGDVEGAACDRAPRRARVRSTYVTDRDSAPPNGPFLALLDRGHRGAHVARSQRGLDRVTWTRRGVHDDVVAGSRGCSPTGPAPPDERTASTGRSARSAHPAGPRHAQIAFQPADVATRDPDPLRRDPIATAAGRGCARGTPTIGAAPGAGPESRCRPAGPAGRARAGPDRSCGPDARGRTASCGSGSSTTASSRYTSLTPARHSRPESSTSSPASSPSSNPPHRSITERRKPTLQLCANSKMPKNWPGPAAIAAPAGRDDPVGVERRDVQWPGDELVVAEAFTDGPEPARTDDVVGIAHRDRVRTRLADADVATVSDARGIGCIDPAHPWILRGVAIDDRGGLVGRAVVDHDELPGSVPLLGQ